MKMMDDRERETCDKFIGALRLLHVGDDGRVWTEYDADAQAVGWLAIDVGAITADAGDLEEILLYRVAQATCALLDGQPAQREWLAARAELVTARLANSNYGGVI
jgi:hypothetical protein